MVNLLFLLYTSVNHKPCLVSSRYLDLFSTGCRQETDFDRCSKMATCSNHFMLLHKHLDIQQKAGLYYYTDYTCQTHIKPPGLHHLAACLDDTCAFQRATGPHHGAPMQRLVSAMLKQYDLNIGHFRYTLDPKAQENTKKNTSPESQEKFHADVGSVLMSLDQ